MALLRDLLARHVPDAEVWAYGSRIMGTAHEGSDLDIVLRHAGDPTGDVEGWLELKEAVEQSCIPIIVDIHLWRHLPENFHANIERDNVLVQRGRA